MTKFKTKFKIGDTVEYGEGCVGRVEKFIDGDTSTILVVTEKLSAAAKAYESEKAEVDYEHLETEESDIIYWAKVRDTGVIPTRDADENAGYDIYADLDDDFLVISPGETILIPTGIASKFSSDYVAILKERGSTGTKGMAQRCGVIDASFRGEWKVPITNVNSDKYIIIAKDVDYVDRLTYVLGINKAILYPASKAICQAVFVPVPKLKSREVDFETLKSFKSKRGDGMLGSSGK